MSEPCGNCMVCDQCVAADAELHEQFYALTAMLDRPENERVKQLKIAQASIDSLEREVRALREELEQLRDRNEILDGAGIALECGALRADKAGLEAENAKLREDMAANNAWIAQTAAELREPFKNLEADNERLLATVARVEALPAKWSQASEATPKLLRDGWRQCARELEAALRGELVEVDRGGFAMSADIERLEAENAKLREDVNSFDRLMAREVSEGNRLRASIARIEALRHFFYCEVGASDTFTALEIDEKLETALKGES